jgi:TolB-like protein
MEPLGQGGMATVWLARDLKHDRLVAIKLLRPELAVPLGADRFASEIGIVAKLNHPNILGVIDSGIVQVNGVSAPYYVMPHVEGPSLSALLSRDAKLEVNEALRLAAEVADALAFAHSRGVVHRDIKPGNILIQAGHALVADFGVAIALDAATVGGRRDTAAGVVLGTPVYMSPEQASGESRLDGRSDIYSLGCVLYEMLAGDPPFAGNTPQAMIVAHLNTPPPPLATRRKDIPAALAAVVHKALEKLPSARYANAGEFRDALDRMRAPSVVHRRWWPTAALVVAVAALFWWSPWRKRASQAGPGSDIVVLLSGFRDRSGTMRAESAALDDALRQELQAVPGLRVIDAGDQPEVPVDTLRARYQADWIIRGALDQVGDSVSATVRVVDASNGAEVRSRVLRQESPVTLVTAATSLPAGSLFGAVRYAMDSVLLDRWLLSLGTDSATADLRQRARAIRLRENDAMMTVGPRRMIDELQLADSLLAVAMALSPRSALPAFERALLAKDAGFKLFVARQVFPDSTWLPLPSVALLRGIPFANLAVTHKPNSSDAWFVRSRLFTMLFVTTRESSWRDSALRDLKRASLISGRRADIWTRRADTEIEAGLFRDALFSVEQGTAADQLHVNGSALQYSRAMAELGLLQFENAGRDCRTGAAEYPDAPYFVTCDAEVTGRYSANPADARRLVALGDSLKADPGELPAITADEMRLYAAAIQARAGMTDSAERSYQDVVSGWSGEVDPILLLDAVYLRQSLGDMDSALALAARAARKDPSLVADVERLPWYRPLRDHPLFGAAMRGIPPAEARGR